DGGTDGTDGGDAGHGALDVLLPLRRTGDLPPLFCAHPAAGLSWCYAGLLGTLDRRVPVYGLQSPNLPGPAARQSLADKAADFLKRIREVREHGPYRLLGWSMGGHLAHEMAVQ